MTATAKGPGAFSAHERMVSFRYLRARRKEGFISVIAWFSFIGIMVGVATLIIVMAVMNGFRHELLGKILGMSGHATVYAQAGAPLPDYDMSTPRRLKASPGIEKAIPYVVGEVLVSSNSRNNGARVMGMRGEDIKTLPSVINENLQGTFDGFDQSQGIAIGKRMAWQHRVTIGDTLTLISPDGAETIMGTAPRFRDYPIVAIFEIGMTELDASIIYMPLEEAQEYFVIEGAVTAIELMVDKPDQVSDRINALAASTKANLHFVTWQQANKTLFNALEVERNVMFLILTLIILVAALNIISGLIMLVKDKAKDIAILRTMGASRASIQRIFFMTGAAIGLTGTIAGIILGVVICLNCRRNSPVPVLGARHGDLRSEDLLPVETAGEDGSGRDHQRRAHVDGPVLPGNALPVLACRQARSGRGAAL